MKKFNLWFKSMLCAVMLGIWAFPAVAQSATMTVNWQNPTLNTDGTTIPAAPAAGSLVSTRVQYGSCVGTAFGVLAVEVIANAPAITTTFSNIGPGTYCVRAYAKNTYLVESVSSLVVVKVFAAPTPNAPVIVNLVWNNTVTDDIVS